MKRILFVSLLVILPRLLLSQVTVGEGGTYPSLFEAFNAVNEGNLTGDVTIIIISNITETSTAVLYQPGYNGTADYTSVTVYPDAAGYIIECDFDGPLIEFNGASGVIFDGRTGGTSPDNKDLTIRNINTGTSASTIHFTESATSNIVRYCNIKGSSSGTTSGIILFSTASSGNGNDSNTITYNDISSFSSRPVNAIFSSGSSGSENSENTISNNNISDFLSPTASSNGINISAFSTSFTISANSFYETTTFTPSSAASYNVIRIDNVAGTGFTISGNFIGGQSSSCGGSALTKNSSTSNVFNAIYLNVGTGSASSIQNNTIRNINWTNSGNPTWTGINIAAGAVNIGTTTGNTIGATTGTGSVTVTCSLSGANIYGINIVSSGTVDCRNNNIGSFTTANSVPGNSTNFTGINKTGSGGTVTINNNLIGSTSSANSINASSASTGTAQNVFGINNAGTGSVTISSNTIANLTNSTTNGNTAQTGRVNGIASQAGSLTVSLNTIHDLTISNLNNTSIQTASAAGITLTGNTTNKTISGNTIYNILNSNVLFAGHVIGLYFNGSTGSNMVYNNFIHGISVASGSTASVYGIKIFAGATTYYNNVISLGGSTLTTIYGIYETGAANNNNNIYFNTVYIGGSVGSGTNKSYALYSNAITNARNFRNNILFNARSTTGGANLHYALYFAGIGGTLTCDYNDYFVTGTGGTLGYYGSDKTTSVIVTGQDVSSFAINPGLSSAGGTNASNYQASAAGLVAVTGTGISLDYAGTTRSATYPAMGAYEYTVTPTTWTWTGATNTDWSTATNWNYNTTPPVSGNVVINDVTNDPVVNTALSGPAECQDLTINASGILTVAAGKAFKVNGTITNNAGVTGFVINSDSYGNDGILINNNASVPATVKLYLTGGAGISGPAYHYITPPVQSMAINNSSVPACAASLGVTNFNGDLILYDETKAVANKNAGWQYFDGYGGTTGFTSLVSSRAYNIYLTNNDVITFTGNLNGSAHTFNLSYTGTNPDPGWNLVGNPYPCNYDLNGISELTNSGDGVDNTIYFNNSGGYAYWNPVTGGTTGYSDILPPMQGFFVRVTGTGKSLNLPVAYKSGSAALPVRSKGNLAEAKEEKDITVKKVKLALSKGAQKDETIVCLIEDATPVFDNDYDAFKLFAANTTAPSIYSELGSTKYAINAIKEPAEQTVIPLRVIVKSAGEHMIEIPEYENLDGLRVILRHGSTETVLGQGSIYTFTSATGTFTNFELIIGQEDITTGDTKLQEVSFKTWYANNHLNIIAPTEISEGKGRVIINDLQGKTVIDNNQVYLVPGETLQIPVNLQKGIYIINVLTGNNVFTSKVVIM